MSFWLVEDQVSSFELSKRMFIGQTGQLFVGRFRNQLGPPPGNMASRYFWSFE